MTLSLRTRVALLTLTLAAAPAAVGGAQAVTFTRLAPNLAVLRDSAYASNMTVIRTTAGLIVIDNFMHRTSTLLALAVAADSLGERRIALAVNTHGHDDHTWGNQILAAGAPSPPILAHRATVAYMRARIGQMQDFFSRAPGVARAVEDSLAGGALLSDSARGRLRTRAARIRQNLAAHSDLVVTPPTVSLTTDTVIIAGTTRVVIRSIGAAHSAGDVAVLVPDIGVLAIGDLALVDALPGLDASSGDLTAWIVALDALDREGSKSSVRWVVPGHGAVGDRRTLLATASYLRELRDSVASAIDNGLDLPTTQARVRLNAIVSQPADMERHQRNVEAAWVLLRGRAPH